MEPKDIAAGYVGKLEKPNNSGFKDPAFEDEMRVIAGWRTGLYWCAFFVRLVMRKAIAAAVAAGLAPWIDLVSPSAVTTFTQYKKAGRTGKVPRVNALAVWCHYDLGRPTAKGHISCVAAVASNLASFTSIEGNGSIAGSRNGDRVVSKMRMVDFKPKHEGLVLMGFCYTDAVIPPEATA